MTVREIRSLAGWEAQALSRIGRKADGEDRRWPGGIEAELHRVLDVGGRAWILGRGRMVAGYASIVPVPGLPGLVELDVFITPDQRRQGLGTHLLATIIDRLADGTVRQLSFPAQRMGSPAVQFLLKNGFYVEHEERWLTLDDLSALPAARLERGFSLLTFARRQAISYFRRLYEASFGGLAWYQPYEDEREVDRDLAEASDLLFLVEGRRPIGFLWLRWPDLQSAEIEPIGLLPAYRGRGLGRQMLLAGLSRAAQQGAEQVRIGAWQSNTAALSLYRQLGFRPAGKTLYLAYDLQ